LPFSLTGYSETYFKKLTGDGDIEDSLERLDKLTQEEARMASAEQLKMTHSIDGKVMGVNDRVRGVEGQVQGVRSDVQDVRVDMQDVRVDVQDVRVDVQDVHIEVQDVRVDVQDVRVDVQDVRVDVQDVRGDVRDVGDKVQHVDDRLDQANRSLSFQIMIVIPWPETASQGTSSEIVSYDGFLPQIHP
jgi:predicted  nucleic acid-binding Zn-ribbon protein